VEIDMRRALTLAAILLVAGVAGAQYKKAPSGQTQSPVQVAAPMRTLDSAKRIHRDEARKLAQQNKAVFVDIRSKASFEKGHIKGALHIPGSQLLMRINELPQGKTVITYCACEKESTAARAVLQLNGRGINDAAALLGGWQEWTANGLPTEK
jgi:rhodanese-related sulfurtransferase